MNKVMLSTIIFALLSIMCSAQEVVFKQELSYDTLLMGNVLEIKYSIENANGDFQAPEFQGFTIISGPNVSSQFSMINGTITQSASYTYFLRPNVEGVITIESASLENGENLWTTEPIDIVVQANPDGIIQNPRGYGFSQEIIYSDSTTTKMDSIKMKLKKLKTYKI